MLTLLLLWACKEGPLPTIDSDPIDVPPLAMQDVTDAAVLGDCLDLIGVALADFDADRDDDLALSCGAHEPPRLFENVDGRMSDLTHSLPELTDPAYLDRHGITFGQADADRELELLVVTGTGLDQLYDWDGEKWEDVGPEFGLTDPQGNGSLGLWFDADGDLDQDLFVGHRVRSDEPGPNVNILWENGPWRDIAGGLATEAEDVSAAMAADWDNDGDLDLLTAARCSGEIYRCDDDTGGSLRYYDNAGDFTGSVCEDTRDVVTLASADLDGDGLLDLALGRWGSGVSVRLNPGDGLSPCLWPEQRLGPEGALTTALVLADFDNDGDKDLFAAHHNAGSAPDPLWRLNDGLGFFTTPLEPAPPIWDTNERVFAAAMDIDDDGWVDLLVGTEAGQPGSRLHILRNITGESGSPYRAVVMRGLPAGSRVSIDGQVEAFAIAGGPWRVDASGAVHAGIGAARSVELKIELPSGEAHEYSDVAPGCYAIEDEALVGC